MNLFEHATAHTVDEALALLAAPSAAPIAGGTDLLNTMAAGLERPTRLVDIKPIGELREVSGKPDGGLRVGALVTLTQLIHDPRIGRGYEVLKQAVQSAASPQLRNMGTVGGNLCQRPRCWYFRGPFVCLRKGGDTCHAVDGENQRLAVLGGGPCHIVHPSDLAPALLALDAEVVIGGPTGQTLLLLGDFFLGPRVSLRRENVLQPGQLILWVQLRPPGAGARGVYLKAMERRSWAFALSSVAVQMRVSRGVARDVRIVLGGVAPVPWRAREAEAVVEGRRVSPDLAAEAARRALATAEPMSQNAYKVPLAQTLVERALRGAYSSSSRIG